MTRSEFTARVTMHGALATAGAAALAGWVAGGAASAGVVAGGGLALLDFRWLARTAGAAGALTGGRLRVTWMLAAAARLLVMFGAIALLLVSDRVAPLALVAGLAVLPVVVIAQGLRATRQAD